MSLEENYFNNSTNGDEKMNDDNASESGELRVDSLDFVIDSHNEPKVKLKSDFDDFDDDDHDHHDHDGRDGKEKEKAPKLNDEKQKNESDDDDDDNNDDANDDDDDDDDEGEGEEASKAGNKNSPNDPKLLSYGFAPNDNGRMDLVRPKLNDDLTFTFLNPSSNENNANNTNNKTFHHHHHHSSSKSLFQGIFGCIKPILSLWVTKANASGGPTTHTQCAEQDFNIRIEDISDLQWIGSGAQGCVFRGTFRNELVAIKKVKSKEETNVKHLRRLEHPNLVKIKGISVNSANFYGIVMEYCPHGQLYTYLSNLKTKSPLKPAQYVDWSKQIGNAMLYLHANKIIHRDLKSPNILIGHNWILKVSDFGASKNINERSAVMSFKGTVAWMPPEVIRNEACSEKVDVYSFGVVLWEMMTCEIPFKEYDQNSIMWGVGSNKLSLMVPNYAPDGVKLLIQLCLNPKARNRPSFSQILKHLDVIEKTDLKNDAFITAWPSSSSSSPTSQNNSNQSSNNNHNNNNNNENNTNANENNNNNNNNAIMVNKNFLLADELLERRNEELKHAAQIRELYEKKMEKANNLYFELNTVMLQLEEREKQLIEREKVVQIYRKKIVRPLIKREFQDRSSTTTSTHLATNKSSNKQRHQRHQLQRQRSNSHRALESLEKQSSNDSNHQTSTRDEPMASTRTKENEEEEQQLPQQPSRHLSMLDLSESLENEPHNDEIKTIDHDDNDDGDETKSKALNRHSAIDPADETIPDTTLASF